MKGPPTDRPNGAATPGPLRARVVHAGFLLIAPGLFSLLLAHAANSQGSDTLARRHQAPQQSSYHIATAGASMTTSDGPFLSRTEPAGLGWAIAPAAPDSSPGPLWAWPTLELESQTLPGRLAQLEAVAPGYAAPDTVSVSFQHPTRRLFLAFTAVSGRGLVPDQLLAAIGIRGLSFRINSWSAVGRGPSVDARALALVRRVRLLRNGAELSLGGGATVYKLGSRFDPGYRRHPISIQILFRLRFGSHADGPTGPAGYSRSL